MPATKQPEQRQDRHDLERDRRAAFHSLIGEQVIHALGKPGDLLQVQVRPLWENYYRANVFIGKDAGSAARRRQLLPDGRRRREHPHFHPDDHEKVLTVPVRRRAPTLSPQRTDVTVKQLKARSKSRPRMQAVTIRQSLASPVLAGPGPFEHPG